jgi:hypothetical protein
MWKSVLLAAGTPLFTRFLWCRIAISNISQTVMSLCDVCHSIPTRKILRFFGGDKSFLSEFHWWKDPSKPYNPGDPFYKWHDTLQQLQASANNCAFCGLISERLQVSNRFKAIVKPEDQRAVWLRIPTNNNHLHVFLGYEEPAVLVSGRLLFSATPGMK